jgi:hypothetical protein
MLSNITMMKALKGTKLTKNRGALTILSFGEWEHNWQKQKTKRYFDDAVTVATYCQVFNSFWSAFNLCCKVAAFTKSTQDFTDFIDIFVYFLNIANKPYINY